MAWIGVVQPHNYDKPRQHRGFQKLSKVPAETTYRAWFIEAHAQHDEQRNEASVRTMLIQTVPLAGMCRIRGEGGKRISNASHQAAPDDDRIARTQGTVA